MYSRYKVKKKRFGIIKTIIVLLIISAILSLGYKYSKYLFFWKYSYNKLQEEIEKVKNIRDIENKREELIKLTNIFEDYKNENSLQSDSFLFSGKVHYYLGETYLSGSFSELLINDKVNYINPKARREFIKVIKDIRKGKALLNENELPGEYSLIFAKAGYYSKYYDVNAIYKIIKHAEEHGALEKIDDIRFFAIINILNKREDYGLKYLSEHGMIDESIHGRLFLATSEKIAKHYTNSIMNYKDILKKTIDDKILKLVHMNLGKVYFYQLLFKESLYHFNTALKIDERDNLLRVWIGKNYLALGDKDKAKSIWSEVLASDRKNNEIKELLGIM